MKATISIAETKKQIAALEEKLEALRLDLERAQDANLVQAQLTISQEITKLVKELSGLTVLKSKLEEE